MTGRSASGFTARDIYSVNFIVFGQSAGAMIIGSLLLADGGQAVSFSALLSWRAVYHKGGWVTPCSVKTIVRDPTMIDTR